MNRIASDTLSDKQKEKADYAAKRDDAGGLADTQNAESQRYRCLKRLLIAQPLD